ncbi:glycerophosphoryl diester phosphodiesterase family protein [Trichodelitschia bisporula]|uniref:glycerophosphodiester phosphodiesterase n=1 Tax=Trichodelitschia bisporula TaxID=703511 RepID=A0A6G1HWW7_9PEZI|nr:glycerophosphoryl diester phosphodiesterase family protein [Trichodelitschia bisporula]
MRPSLPLLLASSAAALPWGGPHHHQTPMRVELGPRPYYLVDNMDAGPLKDQLAACSEGPFHRSDFVFAHRGAPLQFPEHTREGYAAAARMGAGVIECDVTFTADKQLVCRHSMCDLHSTTDILTRPELAKKCTQGFTPADNQRGIPASANCCTADITLAEFESLCAKMDGVNLNATTLTEYLDGTPRFRTDLYATCGTLMTHKAYIAMVDDLGLKFTSEAKLPAVPMPFNGYTQEQFLSDIIADYKAAGIDASRVWPQSFQFEDIAYWIKTAPDFAEQALFLDPRVSTQEGYINATASLPGLAAQGLKIVAPGFWALTQLDANKKIVPSAYAVAARKAGLDIVTWSFDRSGWLNKGGDSFYQPIHEVINNDGDMYTVLDVLVKQVGIKGLFTDWAATVVYYANCFGL